MKNSLMNTTFITKKYIFIWVYYIYLKEELQHKLRLYLTNGNVEICFK